MTFKHFESGRSMVEMLGVLAVVGVLSIGGIMGYSYGMDKYRANQTMQEITLRAIDVLAQYDRTGDANLNEWQNEKTIYPITLEEDTIGIQVDEVPERVCDMITEGMVHVAKGTKVNGSYVVDDGNTCDGDENSLVFYFDEEGEKNTGPNSPEEEGNINEPVQEQCGDTVCEQCFKCDKSTTTCVSVMDELYESADNVDDFRICASNGYKSYCGLLGDGCAELGSANCAGMGDPDCVAYIDGSCQLLDSTMYMQEGVGGFRCTKNGQDSYCIQGQCAESCMDNTGCGECELCDEVSHTCVPLTGMIGSFSVPGVVSDFTCTTANGTKSYCGALFGGTGCLERCSECQLNIDGSCENLDSGLFLLFGVGGFTCTKDGQSGYCMSGVCQVPGDSSVCESDGTDAECMINLDGTCVPSEAGSQCSANGYNGYCLGFGFEGAKCLPPCDNCTDNQYCGDLNTSYQTANPMVCKDLDFSEYSIDGTTYYISNNDMSWWDNEAACVALSKKTGKTLRMISKNELIMRGEPNVNSGQARTALLKKLYETIGNGFFWTIEVEFGKVFAVSSGNSINGLLGNYYQRNTKIYSNGDFLRAICR